jgi:uncharacterized membrane protein YeaQ/YmgE (transglycosylase-associated protein family)
MKQKNQSCDLSRKGMHYSLGTAGHTLQKRLTMQQETIKDYLTAIVVGIVGALVLLHSLGALFY